MRLQNCSKGFALSLLLLTVLSVVEPILLRFAAPTVPNGLPVSVSAAPISEEAFVNRLLHGYTTRTST